MGQDLVFLPKSVAPSQLSNQGVGAVKSEYRKESTHIGKQGDKG